MADGIAKESLSLEETNKVRISLGLKPLVEDDGQAGENADMGEDEEARAEANYEAVQADAVAARRTADLKAKLDRHANQRALNAKLAGRTLADLDPEGDVDASSWVKSSKKRTKKAQAELAVNAEREKAEAAATLARGYDERDLTGMKVGHDVDDFGEGEQHTLVLKDSRIEDDEDDELTNVRLADLDRTKDRLEINKKAKKAGYTGYDDDEFAADGTPRAAGVLSKYDDEDKESGFTLGASGSDAAMSNTPRRAKPRSDDEPVNRTLLSLDYTKNLDVSDYLQAGDKGFKKPKKKRAKATARQIDAEDVIVPVETVERVSAEELRDQAMRDDEDLQAALARERVKKSRAKLGSAAARRRALEEASLAQPEAGVTSPVPKIKQEEEDAPAGIEFDDMTEFVRNIRSAREAAADAEAAGARSVLPSRVKSEPLEAGDVPMAELENRGHEDGELGDDQAPYQGDDNAAMDVDGGDHDVKPDVHAEREFDPIIDGTSNEMSYGKGLAAALKIVKQQGLLKELTEEDRQRDAESREKSRWLAQRRAEERAIELERQRMREAGSSISQAERERLNRERERNRAQTEMAAFDNYQPNVAINYFDDHGRAMTQKEQWKAICHHFHGKGSGHLKEEKRLKRIADEQRREAIASGDTPSGTTAAFLARQERTGSATMVIAVGNNNAAPMPEGGASSSSHRHLAANKGARTVKSKGKAKLEDVVAGASSTAPAHGPQLGAETPLVNLTPTIGAMPPKQPSAGFARIGSRKPAETAAPVKPAAASPAPIGGGGIRIALKRGAEGDLPGSPAEKRGRTD